jgi:hypothetical protein
LDIWNSVGGGGDDGLGDGEVVVPLLDDIAGEDLAHVVGEVAAEVEVDELEEAEADGGGAAVADGDLLGEVGLAGAVGAAAEGEEHLELQAVAVLEEGAEGVVAVVGERVGVGDEGAAEVQVGRVDAEFAGIDAVATEPELLVNT